MKLGNCKLYLVLFFLFALSLTHTHKHTHAHRLVVGDELKLRLDAAAARANGGPWEGVGHVQWLEDSEIGILYPVLHLLALYFAFSPVLTS